MDVLMFYYNNSLNTIKNKTIYTQHETGSEYIIIIILLYVYII